MPVNLNFFIYDLDTLSRVFYILDRDRRTIADFTIRCGDIYLKAQKFYLGKSKKKIKQMQTIKNIK